MLIEDEEVVMDVCKAFLEKIGYNVLAAETGKKAVDIACSFDGNIDAALMDIILPDMSGEEIYPVLIRARPNLKVLLFSGSPVEGSARKILDAGADGFIPKPLSIATLSEKMDAVFVNK